MTNHHSDRIQGDTAGAIPTSKRKAEPPAAMIGVYYEQRRIGHVLMRGDEGFEAYDHNERSLGVFNTEDEATTEVWKAAR
jgi:hypothetical protein